MAHAGGSLVSGFVASLIARRAWYKAAAGMGMLWMCGGLFMLTVLPCPVWFAVADIILYVPAALLGARMAGTLTASHSPTTN